MSDLSHEHLEAQDDERASRVRVALIAALVLLMLLLAGLGVFIARVVTPVGAPTTGRAATVGMQWVRSIYGYGRGANQQFVKPVGVAVGPGGRIWGTDPNQARILGFTPQGAYSTLIHRGPASKGAGRIFRVEGITTDADGNVYACDFGGEKVMVFGPDGAFVREWAVPLPNSVAVAGERVYVGSTYGVAVFDRRGTLQAVWGKRGKGPEDFDVVHGVAVGQDGTVYVADTQNRRVKAYTAEGALKWVWPKDRRVASPAGIVPTATAQSIQLPMSIAVDAAGRLVVADAFSFDLVVLKPGADGATLVARYGTNGSRDGEFLYPSGIAYDRERDWFVVADTYNDRLQIVRIVGSAPSDVLPFVRRTLDGPAGYCGAPLILLLLAIAVAVFVRRRRRSQAADAEDASGGEVPFTEEAI